MCSGTDSPVLVLRALSAALSKRCITWKPRHVFSAEKHAKKRSFLQAMMGDSMEHLFHDCTALDSAAMCDVHRSRVPVPVADFLYAGFRCQDVSLANPHRKRNVDDVCSGELRTGKVFQEGVLKYLKQHSAESQMMQLAILENVVGLAAKSKVLGHSPLDWVSNSISEVDHTNKPMEPKTEYIIDATPVEVPLLITAAIPNLQTIVEESLAILQFNPSGVDKGTFLATHVPMVVAELSSMRDWLNEFKLPAKVEDHGPLAEWDGIVYLQAFLNQIQLMLERVVSECITGTARNVSSHFKAISEITFSAEVREFLKATEQPTEETNSKFIYEYSVAPQAKKAYAIWRDLSIEREELRKISEKRFSCSSSARAEQTLAEGCDTEDVNKLIACLTAAHAIWRPLKAQETRVSLCGLCRKSLSMKGLMEFLPVPLALVLGKEAGAGAGGNAIDS